MRSHEGVPDGERDGARPPLAHDPFEVAVRAGPAAPAGARAAITEWLTDRATGRVLDDVRLVVSELVTNSVCHGGLRVGDLVEVRAQVTGTRLRLEVEDAGRAGAIVRSSAPADGPGGMGLQIVEDLVVRWGVSLSHGTTVWAELDLVAGAEPGVGGP